MFRTIVAITAILIAVGVVAAQSNTIQKRNNLMSALWKEGLAAPFRMTKGREPFDKEKAEAGLTKMSEIVEQLPPLWPPNSKPVPPLPKYSSSLKVWDNKPDFDAKLAKLTKSIADSRGKVTDPESLQRVVTTINQNCDGCHEAYQVRNQ